jgi:predicted DNA-binding transcriptional regulator AlpA
MAPTLLTPVEVAEALRTPVATLRHWRDKRTGPMHVKIGKRIMYREQDVLAWLDEQAEKAAEQRKAAAR